MNKDGNFESGDENIKNSITEQAPAKRVLLDSKTLQKIKIMFPMYTDDSMKEKEQLSMMVQKAIDYLFENDFKKKLEIL